MLKESKCVQCGQPFTFTARRGTQPITCSPQCGRARKTKVAAERRRTTPIPDHVHGTVSGYTDYNCPCTPCKEAWAEYQREYRRRDR